MNARRWATAFATATLVVGLLGTSGATADTSIGGAVATRSAATSGCQRVLTTPMPVEQAARQSATAIQAAAQVARISPQRLLRLATDEAQWLDTCGRRFYAEPRTAEAEPSRAPSSRFDDMTVPLENTFELASKPDADRTIYLDFTGGVTAGSQWNADFNNGANIAYAPFSITSPADTAFSDAELRVIQAVWNTVAEDYAPFDVNVTTREPDPSALERTDLSDSRYGTRVAITQGGPIASRCGCGGVAYLDVFHFAGSNQALTTTAWVFAGALNYDGKFMGDAASHEVGHMVGLLHDGVRNGSAYYGGDRPWGPIMGAPYTVPLTQWSNGSYRNASEQQDDLAVIGSRLPSRADEAPDAAVNIETGRLVSSAARALAAGVTERAVISSRTDTDVWSFSTPGPTTLRVNTAPAANLDAQLRIFDQTGSLLHTVNPPAAFISDRAVDGLDAEFSGDLPPGNYFAVIDGIGTGTPATVGSYDDYGSLGSYTISVGQMVVPTPDPLVLTSLVGTTPVLATEGTALTGARVAEVSGGVAPYQWSAENLPAGLSVDADTGLVSGVPSDPTIVKDARLSVLDAAGRIASTSFRITVNNEVAKGVVVNNVALNAYRTRTKSFTVRALAGSGVKTWEPMGMPAWVSMGRSGSFKVLSMRPAEAVFTVKVTLTDRNGIVSTDTAVVSVRVLEPTGRLSFFRPVFKTAYVGVPYTAGLGVVGGAPNYEFEAGGFVPFGTELSFVDGYEATLRGTPTTAGSFGFYIAARDRAGSVIYKNITITVRQPPAPQ